MSRQYNRNIKSVPQIYLGDEFIGSWAELNEILYMEFNFKKLHDITRVITRNLNRVIDVNLYTVEEARNSNMKHRPIGISVQGLADVFQMFKYPFESAEAKKLNIDIFETIYYASLTASKDLSIENGPYETWKGSPISEGVFQFDLWNVNPSDRWEWDLLREEVKKHGENTG